MSTRFAHDSTSSSSSSNAVGTAAMIKYCRVGTAENNPRCLSFILVVVECAKKCTETSTFLCFTSENIFSFFG